MNLIKFTDALGGAPVYVNPDQVVCVSKVGNDTTITTTAVKNDGGGKVISVREPVSEVVGKLMDT